jgi:transposase
MPKTNAKRCPTTPCTITHRGKELSKELQAKFKALVERESRHKLILAALNVPHANVTSVCNKLKVGRATVIAVRDGVQRTDSAQRSEKNKSSECRKRLLKRRQIVVKLAKSTLKLGSRIVPAFPTASQIRTELRRAHKIKVSEKTVCADLRHEGLTCYVRKKIPYNRSDKCVEARKKFAAREEWQDIEHVKRLVFSDEHYVSTNDKYSRWQWATSRKFVLPRESKSRYNIRSIMVWAAVGYNYKSELVVFPKKKKEDAKGFERMNQDIYKRKCLVKRCNSGEWDGKILIHDGATCHQAEGVTRYLASKKMEVVEDWPAYSPDFNMIEIVWDWLDQQLSKFAPAETEQELIINVQEAWKKVSQTKINNLVMSFSKRMREKAAAEL